MLALNSGKHDEKEEEKKEEEEGDSRSKEEEKKWSEAKEIWISISRDLFQLEKIVSDDFY